MKKWKILFDLFIVLFIAGGIMGIIKGLFPDMEWLSFRYLLGFGSTFSSGETPIYATVYGLVMAILEIVMAVVLIVRSKNGITIALIIITVNAVGCVISIFFKDFLAIFSLILRLLSIIVLNKAKAFYNNQ